MCPSKTISVEMWIRRAPRWVLICASLRGSATFIFSASSGSASTASGEDMAAQLIIASGHWSRQSLASASELVASSCMLVWIPRAVGVLVL